MGKNKNAPSLFDTVSEEIEVRQAEALIEEPELTKAKGKLDSVIGKSRIDLYKPIQVAEVLFHSRHGEVEDIRNVETFKNRSCKWRDEVTLELLGKRSTSSAQFQHNLWDENAVPPEALCLLDKENKEKGGIVERYIYQRFIDRRKTVSSLFDYVFQATPENFYLEKFLGSFVKDKGIKRSIDKAFEIVTYSLFQTVVTQLDASVTVSVPEHTRDILEEFSALTKVLLGVDSQTFSWSEKASIYRVGVTNSADRGLDMWANFGPAIQVKHLTLDQEMTEQIVDQVESDRIVIVCLKKHEKFILAVLSQISWGQRVKGIITQVELVDWYNRCLRGRLKERLGLPLLNLLRKSLGEEFGQVSNIESFLDKRGYREITLDGIWASES